MQSLLTWQIHLIPLAEVGFDSYKQEWQASKAPEIFDELKHSYKLWAPATKLERQTQN